MEVKILNKIESILNYKFNDPALLYEALSHDSYANNKGCASYQRLEFLGDGIIGFVIDEILYSMHPDYSAGQLTFVKQKIVSTQPLSQAIKKLGMDVYINVAKKTEISDEICEDVFESIAGAIYMDSGLEEAKKFILSNLKTYLDNVSKNNCIDYKSRLNVDFAKHNREFKTIKEEGPAHKRIFTMALFIDGQMVSKAEGTSKKNAEQECARLYLESIK